jgi:hypothetical protein
VPPSTLAPRCAAQHSTAQHSTYLVREHHFVLVGEQHITKALAVEYITCLPRVARLHHNIVKHLHSRSG